MLYDFIIIGGSAAGTTAAIYAARRGLNFKIITKDFGGEIITSGEIGNWPGGGNTDGITLTQQFRDHLELYGVQPEEGVAIDSITRIENGTFRVEGDYGSMPSAGAKLDESKIDPDKPKLSYNTKVVIVATGVHPRELNVPGEKEFRSKGVSYCTTCDGPIFKNKVTAVVGGGNSALESALMLADIASKVYLINKNTSLKGEQVLIDKLSAKKNVTIIYSAGTKSLAGDKFVKSLIYTDENGADQELTIDGVFVHIGQVPNSDVVSENVEKNKFKEIIVNEHCETNVPGLYAAGDVTSVPFKQIVIAASQGCIAALSAVQYLNRK